MDDLISKLSEIRSDYNCFDEDEEPYYRALSEAIKILSQRADGDTISRKAAMDAICNACGKIDCDKMDKCEKLQLPPANCSEIPNGSDDTISRRVAIDALREKVFHNLSDEYYGAMQVLDELPSAQPEIIRCKDCKYMIDTGDDLMCDNAKGWVVATASNFGCVLAERRTND